MFGATANVIFFLIVIMVRVGTIELPTPEELLKGTAESVKYVSHPQDRAKTYAKDARDFSQWPDKSQQPQKKFTRAEVAKFDGEDGRPIYIIFGDRVYDVTDYVDFHPAGPEPIKKHTGEDVSEVMRDTAMPQWVYDELLVRFQIGSVLD